jgi:hypothetical protein
VVAFFHSVVWLDVASEEVKLPPSASEPEWSEGDERSGVSVVGGGRVPGRRAGSARDAPVPGGEAVYIIE